MRKILLASAALVLVTGTAMAAGNASVGVTANVSASCTLTEPNDVTFGTDPEVGDFDTSSFVFTCNFEDVETTGVTVTIDSTNNGLLNPADADVRDYTVAYNGGPAVLASALAPIADASAGAGDPNPRSFVVALAEVLPVAGAYDDTLTVSIAP